MKKVLKTFAAIALTAGLIGCSSGTSSNDDKTITVGATEVPHAEILNDVVKDVLAKDGWTLEVVSFTDYVQPNTSLDSKELDANYFQTLGYMNDQNETNGFSFVAIAGVHIEPMGVYSAKYTSSSELPDGAEIGIPNDTDNLLRGIHLLIQQGLLNEPADGYDVTTYEKAFSDSTNNPHGYKLVPLEAASLPLNLKDLDAAAINGNYALEAGLEVTGPALLVEEFDEESTIARTNFIVVNDGTQNSEKIQALVKAIQSDEVAKYIEDTYQGAVITSFIGEQK